MERRTRFFPEKLSAKNEFQKNTNIAKLDPFTVKM